MSETTEKRPALFITGNRTGYGPSQIEDHTMTVADLIDPGQAADNYII